MVIYAELFARFLVISLIAFGGGQAALPLIERGVVQEAGWLTPAAFGAAVAFSYVTPGPVLIIATFVGFHVAGVLGAAAATVGVFIAPTILAAMAAAQVERFAEARWLRDFGAGAAPAAVGLLGVTVVDLARDAVVAWPFAVVAVVALALVRWTHIHPAVILLISGLAGAATSLRWGS